MSFSVDLTAVEWLWLGHILFGLILVRACWQAAWWHLWDNKDIHVFFGTCLIVWMLWLMRAGITSGMEFHILLVTTVTLMFGWQFAVICTSIAQIGVTLMGQAEWGSFSLNVLCNGVIPALVTYAVYWVAYYLFPKHFFIYIYICAFAGGALSMLLSRLAGLSILLLSQTYTMAELGEQPLFIIVMLFPEAFINGALVTLLVVFRPQWIGSFNDDVYLRGK
ncbi:putative membrane protein [Beggiatoa alba B18LD]|uniref:Putative membrane protein n=1 Tax=Beggiatoa alba B18LD TaxID=395493 RepID=I3CD84_9GAMM|nr:energy-coupling factor ABC transporter permease [Beggiatoa alba]EIJ41577.1 putative membrane protein [Beggiatoa alba B18LD]